MVTHDQTSAPARFHRDASVTRCMALIQSRRPRRAVLLSAMLACAAACAAPPTAVADHGPVAQGAKARDTLTSALVLAGQGRVLKQRPPASLPASASPAVLAEACPPEAEGAVCGHVDVPFDRSDPSAGAIAVHFELYPHSAPGPAESAILVNFGGPGVSTTSLRLSRRSGSVPRSRTTTCCSWTTAGAAARTRSTAPTSSTERAR